MAIVIETTAWEWFVSGDTGISSRFIWSIMTGLDINERKTDNYPRDPADFGRCYRLLLRFPWWLSRLDEVAKVNPEWEPLVENWDELTRLYEMESPSGRAPHLYERMKGLVKRKVLVEKR